MDAPLFLAVGSIIGGLVLFCTYALRRQRRLQRVARRILT
jgi:hypothetical protein